MSSGALVAGNTSFQAGRAHAAVGCAVAASPRPGCPPASSRSSRGSGDRPRARRGRSTASSSPARARSARSAAASRRSASRGRHHGDGRQEPGHRHAPTPISTRRRGGRALGVRLLRPEVLRLLPWSYVDARVRRIRRAAARVRRSGRRRPGGPRRLRRPGHRRAGGRPVRAAVAEAAPRRRVATGGHALDRGNYVAPTVVAGLPPGQG